jgi:hypothetical protein
MMRGLGQGARDERGYMIPYVLALLMIALALGAAGLAESLSSRSLSARDARARRAQQAADAGIQRVLYEEAQSNIGNWDLNGGPLGLSTTLDCLPVTLNASAQITGLATAFVNSAGVCPMTSSGSAFTDDSIGNHGHEQAEFIPGQTNPFGGAARTYWPKIVSLGWDDNGTNKVYSREEVMLQPIAPLQAVEGMNNVTLTGLGALGLGAVAVNGDVWARGTLTLPTAYAGFNLNTTLSGSIKATVAAPTISGSLVSTINGGTISQGQIPLRPAITIASSKSSCPGGGCPSVAGVVGSDGYNSTTHTFTMTNPGESVTFQPGDYVLCNFNVTAGTVNVNPSSSAPVRIFVDNPNSSRCSGNGLGSAQGNFNAATGINNLLSGATAPSGLQIYAVGDGGGYDNSKTVNIAVPASCSSFSILHVCLSVVAPVTQSMVIYAPTSAVTVDTGACIAGVCAAGTYSGAIVGDNVSLRAATISQDLDLGNYPLYDGVTVFRPVQYVECDTSVHALTGAASDLSGC